MDDSAQQAICQFYRLIPGAPEPRAADRSAIGTLTVNAYRYCEAITSASGFGWYLYPPMNFALMLDDDELFWTYDGADGWYPLHGGAQFPDYRKTFKVIAPSGLGELAPPFLAPGSLPGGVQIWSGCFARTAPGWALLSRGIANYQKTQSYKNVEGIIETSTWFGPLFTNIRLTRTNVPIQFHMRRPFFQVQPLMRECYQAPSFSVLEATDLSKEDWRRFSATIDPNLDQMRRPGHYAVATRKRLRSVSSSKGRAA